MRKHMTGCTPPARTRSRPAARGQRRPLPRRRRPRHLHRHRRHRRSSRRRQGRRRGAGHAARARLERETGPVADRVREAITIANNEIYRLASTRPEWNGMACVLTVAVVDDGKATIGHVGDTRLYKIRQRGHRESHARSLACRRARGCARDFANQRRCATRAATRCTATSARSRTSRTIPSSSTSQRIAIRAGRGACCCAVTG